MKKHAHFIFILFVIIGIFILFAADAYADIDNTGILTNVTNTFKTESAKWIGTIIKYANWLFWTLAAISLVFSFGYMFVEGADLGKFFATFLRFTITLGLFWWLLTNGPNIAADIIRSMVKIAGDSSGYDITEASGIMDLGFQIFDKMNVAIRDMSWGASIVAGIISILVLVIMALVAANVTIEWCATWVLLYAGCIVLGFGSLSFSREYAIQYYKAILAQGMRLMSMIFLVGMAASIILNFGSQIQGSLQMKDCATILIVAIILHQLMEKIPAMLSSLMGANTPAIGTVGIGTALAVGSGATALGSMAASGAGAVMGNAVGIGQLYNAVKAAGQKGASGAISGGDGHSGGGSSSGSGLGSVLGASSRVAATIGKASSSMVMNAIKEKGANSAAGKLAEQVTKMTSTAPSGASASSGGKNNNAE